MRSALVDEDVRPCSAILGLLFLCFGWVQLVTELTGYWDLQFALRLLCFCSWGVPFLQLPLFLVWGSSPERHWLAGHSEHAFRACR